MPIVNVKRFSRSKLEPAAAETPVLSLALPSNSYDENDYVDDNDDSAEKDNLFQDLGRTAFEAAQIADERAAENAILETKRQKEIAKAENEMAKKIASMQKKAESKKQRVSPANTKTTNDENDDNVFSDQGSEILGCDKRQLITKVVQYKQLFPQQLKTFKVKKNANVQELRDALQEMEVIVQTSSLDEFVIDSILATLKLVEGVSSYSTYSNISGLSETLRLNPQFNSLVKQLYIKYNTFSNVPPEQLAILVITSAYVCVQKNKNRAQIDAFLNEPVIS